jgi:hypothetical protein
VFLRRLSRSSVMAAMDGVYRAVLESHRKALPSAKGTGGVPSPGTSSHRQRNPGGCGSGGGGAE